MTTTRLLLATALTVVLLMSVTSTAEAQRRNMTETVIGGHTMYTLLKPGDIPAIFEPTFLRANDSSAERLHDLDEPMIAVTANGIAKAYSTTYLDHHEVVNDSISGSAIAVTW
ncbi:MAG: DUF3179 domain-containing protein [candidate division Zixibacteria bacterium]|nr:DUF3179 domain-containing protein [candidate division Zixibacteria bacterium]